MRTIYELDSNDVIIATGGSWDEFALRNDGETALSSKVIGRSIWSFVSGTETEELLKLIFKKARSERNVALHQYRCDSPRQGRLFQMRVISDEDRGLAVFHDLICSFNLAIQQEAPLTISASKLRKCSVCCRYQYEGDWLEPGAQIFPTGSKHNEACEHTVCPDCLTRPDLIADKAPKAKTGIRNLLVPAS